MVSHMYETKEPYLLLRYNFHECNVIMNTKLKGSIQIQSLNFQSKLCFLGRLKVTYLKNSMNLNNPTPSKEKYTDKRYSLWDSLT